MKVLKPGTLPNPPSWVGREVSCRCCRALLLIEREEEVRSNQIVCPTCGHVSYLGDDPRIYPTLDRVGG